MTATTLRLFPEPSAEHPVRYGQRQARIREQGQGGTSQPDIQHIARRLGLVAGRAKVGQRADEIVGIEVIQRGAAKRQVQQQGYRRDARV